MLLRHSHIGLAVCFFLVGMTVLEADDTVFSKAERLAKVKAARPLNHHVHVTRTCSVLKLEYQLLGEDGKKYNLWDLNTESKPQYAIYHDGRCIENGTFEFG